MQAPRANAARNVLVTGANRGLGLAFCHRLLARGDHVVAACRHPGKAVALNTLVGHHPGRLHVLPLDVAAPKSHDELARELPLVLGEEGRLDLLINNAGVLHSGERFGKLTAPNFEDSFRTNALGPLLLTQALAPLLVDGARVVNLSSQLGAVSQVARFGTPSYAVSKAALNMVGAQLAHALHDRGIVVACVHPGWVNTDMGGEGAQITPETSAAGLLDVIDALQPEDSGRFLDWQGETVAW